MPATFSTNWTGKPELHKIVNVDDGRTYYFFDKSPKIRTFEGTNQAYNEQGLPLGENEAPTYEEGGYSGLGDLGAVRSAWEKEFPGVAFPDPKTATPGAGVNTQGNVIPGQFSGNEYIERGNAGHGSWMDQQGGEIMSDVLRGAAAFISGGLSELLFSAAGSDGSAEENRGANAGLVGGLAGTLFNGGIGSSGEQNPDTSTPPPSTSPTTTETTGLSSSPAQTAGVADTPAQALNSYGEQAPAAQTSPSQALNTNPGYTVDPSTGDVIPNGSAPPPSGTKPTGLIDSVLKFGKDNKEITSGLMQIGGGLLKGVGDRAGANERLEKSIQAQKELENQKLQNQMNLQQFLRQHTQSGSFFDTALPFRPGANTALKRPGGANVYTSDGLIARGMR